MSFEEPELPYAVDALAPYISEKTLSFHFGKHHKGYANKLRAAVKDTPQEENTLEELIMTADGKVFNCAAQTWNHSFYWNSMSPDAGGTPEGPIKDAIVKSFGSFANFKADFSASAGGHFGSGWAWLVQDGDELKIVDTHDAGNPLRDGTGRPILTCDVWEHAYYLDYQNQRPKYLEAWWDLVNWKFANENLAAAGSD